MYSDYFKHYIYQKKIKTLSNLSIYVLFSIIPLIIFYYIFKIHILLSLALSVLITLIIRSVPIKKRLIFALLSKFFNEKEIIHIIPKNYLPQDFKRLFFYRQFVNKNDLCFDVGANVGNRVETLLKIGAKVIAVEPQEKCCKVLNSQFGNEITIINKGLGEKECMKKFHICDSSEFGLSPFSSFSDEWINACSKEERFDKSYSWDKTIEIEMTTLDKLIENYGMPSFIKIDVEGYEFEVLQGLTHPIAMISFEYTIPEQTNKIEQCIKIVEKFNPNICCNFSIGESMEWALTNWVSVPEFLKLIENKDFITTSQGDIYLKQIKQ